MRSLSCKLLGLRITDAETRIFHVVYNHVSAVFVALTNGLTGSSRSAFMGVAAYLIFGSWLNYNRYSARGWDLVPHSETIRDVPYLLRDWIRRVVNTIQGGGSRGGYSVL